MLWIGALVIDRLLDLVLTEHIPGIAPQAAGVVLAEVVCVRVDDAKTRRGVVSGLNDGAVNRHESSLPLCSSWLFNSEFGALSAHCQTFYKKKEQYISRWIMGAIGLSLLAITFAS